MSAARRRGLVGEEGAGAVLALALVAAVVATASIVLAACGVVVASARVDAATDAAALAAADAAAGWVADDPCARASLVAGANGARVVACTLSGLSATVETVDAGGLPVGGLAVAGPAAQPSPRRAGDARGERGGSGDVPRMYGERASSGREVRWQTEPSSSSSRALRRARRSSDTSARATR